MAEASESVIEAKGLRKTYGSLDAVGGVSLSVRKGEIFGFFGPNGAGKSTMIKLLTGQTALSAGSATVAGMDLASSPTAVRTAMAIMPEEASFYERMPVGDYLRFFAAMAGLGGAEARSRLSSAQEVAEVGEFVRKPIADLSHGQRQRVSIARVLLSDVPLLFLDEPFQGIDIVHRRTLRAHLRAFVDAGGTVFFTSHNLIEAEHIVDRFAFIDKGKLLTIGTAAQLRERYLLPSYAIKVSDPAAAVRVLQQQLHPKECTVSGDEVHLVLADRADLPKVATVIGSAGLTLTELRQQGTMEEVFLQLRERPAEREGP